MRSVRALDGAILLGCVLVPLIARAQTDSAAAALPRVPLVAGDTVRPASRDARSPWVAVGLSAALPGAGQIYTKNYWKVPIIWGLGGYYIYEWFKQNDKYKEYRALYAASISSTRPTGSDQLLAVRDFYRDQRDSFAWYMGALYFLNLVDAYVDGHLYDFDVSPELTADGRVAPVFRASVHLPLY